jgi:hypothetical protein
MKRGTVVAVCHDGKWGRRVKGVVVETRKGHHIKVKFPNPASETEEEVEFWARRSPAVRHERRKPGSCIIYSKRPVTFGGWADIEYFCPWFAVSKWREENDREE